MFDQQPNLFYSTTDFPSAQKVRSFRFSKLENSSILLQGTKKRSLLSAFPLTTKSNHRKIKTKRKNSFMNKHQHYNLTKSELLADSHSKENEKSPAVEIMRSLLLF